MKISAISTALAIVSAVSAIAVPPRLRHSRNRITKRSDKLSKRSDARVTSNGTCAVTAADSVSAPHDNIWEDLSSSEAEGVYEFLTSEFNLTNYENATYYDNFVLWIETLRPNKTDALEYLEKNGSAPARYARAVLFFGADEHISSDYPSGYWETYQVGPLPISNESTAVPMDWAMHKNKIPYETGYRDDLRWNQNSDFYATQFTSDVLLPVLKDLVDDDIENFNQDGCYVDAWGTDPLERDEKTGQVTNWATIFIDINDAEDIMPTGVFFESDITGRDPSKWKIIQWYYNGISYSSNEEFRKAWESKDFVKLPKVDVNNTDWTLITRPENATTRPMDWKLAPVQIEPQGHRWSVDNDKRYFTWMDWTFYISWSRDTGLTFYDVTFKGERIFYELGLQEAIAEYTGDDPFQQSTVYFDRSYGFGNEAFGLIPNYDCPYNAEFFDVTWHSMGASQTQNSSFCVFEFLEDFPFVRHTSEDSISATKTSSFNVRSITTIGNYDYNFLFKFHLDGTLEISVRAAGFIQGAYYNNKTSDPFGYKIHDVLSGSFHDHVLNFKADMDIGGTSNVVSSTALKAVDKKFNWSKKTISTKERVREVIDKETSITWPANGAGVLLVESADQKNAYGNPRAYRIVPGLSPVHRISKGTRLVNENGAWANADVYVTKHKDSESASSSVFNAHEINDPQVKFSDFVNGETLSNEDVVVWFNLGLHHLPNTQDIPNTVFNTAQSSIVFTPFNYFDSEQSRDTLQQMQYTYDTDEWNFYGSDVESCVYDINALSYAKFNYDGLSIGKGTTNDPSP